MWFWWFMLMCNLLTPFLLIVAGRLMWKHCPKEINGVIGYRTKRSMKSVEAWRFAHDYCGRLWFTLGIIMTIPSVLVVIPLIRSSKETIGVVGTIVITIQVLLMLATIIPTENALKKKFPEGE